MRRARLLTLTVTGICLLGTTLVSISSAAAAATLTVTPNSDLGRTTSVHVTGAGWPASVQIGVCQGVVNGTPDEGDCAGLGAFLATTPSGTFATDLVVNRNILVPSVGNVDCRVVNCYVAAAELSDIAGTAVFSPITFDPGVADARIKRRSDGAISGDNVYDFGPGETRQHTIVPGGTWTYALQVQNDGPATADLTVAASVLTNEGFPAPAQFFVGYYDVTSYALGTGGFTFHDVAPGDIETFALRFRVPADAPAGANVNSFVSVSSGNAGITDGLSLNVRVQSPT
jgi:hypothetical protein